MLRMYRLSFRSNLRLQVMALSASWSRGCVDHDTGHGRDPRDRAPSRPSRPWPWLAQVGFALLVLQRVQTASSRVVGAVLRRYFSRIGARVAVCAAMLLYSAAGFEALLFRPHLLATVFPQAPKLFKRVGMEGFIHADQTLPCEASHPGSSCGANARGKCMFGVQCGV